ncbi:hypothetical protein CAEBREN_24362 [Caenorhabditis brenneri]|uniref:Uncharacterized protein n=1 Tax=Caenorhabditis brenneri TaxID=135651 RepID=G0P0C4_CAEBE|nr:hypothetical protein CAEBREN_24362 [Caenorhabditis brenneri]
MLSIKSPQYLHLSAKKNWLLAWLKSKNVIGYTRLERRNVNRSSQESVKEKETVVSFLLLSQRDLDVVQLKVVPDRSVITTTWEQWKRVIWHDEDPRTGPAFNNGLYAVESRRLLEKEEDSGVADWFANNRRKIQQKFKNGEIAELPGQMEALEEVKNKEREERGEHLKMRDTEESDEEDAQNPIRRTEETIEKKSWRNMVAADDYTV